MNIDGTLVGGSKSYVIAEIGTNHGGSVETCMQMIKSAKECGADAVKLQKRNNKTLFVKSLYDSPYTGENSYGKTYGEHREALEFDFEQYKELKAYADELGVTFFATAFDFESVDFLEKLCVPCYKIASGDLLNTPLQKYIAQTGKPVILSTGGGTYADVRRAYETILPINQQLVILQCTASYPCEPDNMYLLVIPEYIEEFPKAVIGLSDHFDGKVMSAAAYALGARVFEKHFTLHKYARGTDHSFSMEPENLKKLVIDLDRVERAMKGGKGLLDCEKKPLFKMGKKLVASRDMKAGEVISLQDIAIKSPNDGIEPYKIDSLIGMSLNSDIKEDENFSFEKLIKK